MTDYQYTTQARDNLQAFYDQEYSSRRELLNSIHKAFTEEGICWCVGCSLSLFVRGIVGEFRDIDIFVANNDAERAKELMAKLNANLVGTGRNKTFNSDDYSHWQKDNCDIDLISGFRVETYDCSFHCPITEQNVEILDAEYLPHSLPVIRLEPMYILYCMMEGHQPYRRWKRIRIENYFTAYEPSKKVFGYYVTNSPTSSIAPWIARKIEENGWV